VAWLSVETNKRSKTVVAMTKLAACTGTAARTGSKVNKTTPSRMMHPTTNADRHTAMPFRRLIGP
jgi:hypothetical protein